MCVVAEVPVLVAAVLAVAVLVVAVATREEHSIAYTDRTNADLS